MLCVGHPCARVLTHRQAIHRGGKTKAGGEVGPQKSALGVVVYGVVIRATQSEIWFISGVRIAGAACEKTGHTLGTNGPNQPTKDH